MRVDCEAAVVVALVACVSCDPAPESPELSDLDGKADYYGSEGCDEEVGNALAGCVEENLADTEGLEDALSFCADDWETESLWEDLCSEHPDSAFCEDDEGAGLNPFREQIRGVCQGAVLAVLTPVSEECNEAVAAALAGCVQENLADTEGLEDALNFCADDWETESLWEDLCSDHPDSEFCEDDEGAGFDLFREQIRGTACQEAVRAVPPPVAEECTEEVATALESCVEENLADTEGLEDALNFCAGDWETESLWEDLCSDHPDSEFCEDDEGAGFDLFREQIRGTACQEAVSPLFE